MCKIHAYLTAACLLGLAACSSNPAAKKEVADAEPATPVEVAKATRGTIHRTVTADAVLFAVNQANVVPKISAPVRRFLVNRGDHVKEGQLLAVLESRDLSAAAEESKGLYQQAQAAYQTITAATMPDDLTKAEADVRSSDQALEAARKVYDNRVVLLKEGALAQKLVDDAKVALVQAQSQSETAQRHLKSLQTVGRAEQIKSAQAQVDAAKAHYQSSEAQLSYSEIRSPITGVVADRPVYPGEMAAAGAPLISIVDVSRVVARANVPVKDAASIRPAKPAQIAGPGGEVKGSVTVVSPAVDPNTTTVEVWVQAANPGERMKPGITVHVSIDAEVIRDAVVVPTAALLSSDEGGEKIMVVGPDSLAHEHKVEVGVRAPDRVQILSGIQDGDQVITAGGLGLDDKARVIVGKAGDKEKDGKDDEKEGAGKK
jgi:HlyD family secretion protein